MKALKIIGGIFLWKSSVKKYVLLLWIGCLASLGNPFIAFPKTETNRLHVITSILPLKHFAEQIGHSRVKVSSLVQPGQNPATFEPLVQQMKLISRAQVYFRIRVPFERAWIHRFHELAPKMKIIDLGLEILALSGKGYEDSHFWTNPLLVRKIIQQIQIEFSSLDPQGRHLFQRNYQRFDQELNALDQYIRKRLKPFAGKSFLVLHPAWDFFAKEYKLKQVSIEKEGKDPGPKDLERLIQWAKKEGVSVVFVQKQFSAHHAKIVAKTLEADIQVLDPLAENYVENLKKVTDLLVRSF